MLYIELDSNLAVAKCEEWIGREYVRDHLAQCAANGWGGCSYLKPFLDAGGAAYPLPPDSYTPAPGFPDPPPEGFSWFYSRAVPLLPVGGVLVVDDEIARFATQSQVLSDGVAFMIDIAATAKTIDQLTSAAQLAVTPPISQYAACSVCNHAYFEHASTGCTGQPVTDDDIALGHCSCPGFAA